MPHVTSIIHSRATVVPRHKTTALRNETLLRSRQAVVYMQFRRLFLGFRCLPHTAHRRSTTGHGSHAFSTTASAPSDKPHHREHTTAIKALRCGVQMIRSAHLGGRRGADGELGDQARRQGTTPASTDASPPAGHTARKSEACDSIGAAQTTGFVHLAGPLGR